MAISETGHAINIDNLRVLYELCTTFGANYNPFNADISIVSMTTLYNDALGFQNDLIAANNATKLPINDREDKFKALKRLVTKTINAFESGGASKQSVRDARGLVRKITGGNVRIKRLEDGTADPKSISNSHQSYVQILDSFKNLVELYKGEASYTPNEVSIQIVSLETLVTELEAANSAVSAVVMDTVHYRSKRDRALYLIGSGVVDIGYACKKYVKSLYGIDSAEYIAARGIKFKRFMKFVE